MFKAIVTASVSVLLLTLASAAGAQSSCQETADTNYAIAVAIDYVDADMVHENTVYDCEYQAALSESHATGSAGIVRTSAGWRQITDEEFEADRADEMLSPLLSMLAR